MAEDKTKMVLTGKDRGTLEALVEHLRGATPSERRAEVAFNYASKIEAILAARPSTDLAEGVGRPLGVMCTSCGSSWDDERLAKERPRNPSLRSCCPERKMVSVYAPGTDPAIARLTERARAAEEECVNREIRLEELHARVASAEAALAQRDANIAKAVEDERDRIIVHVREMMKRFEKGSASQNNFKALADMLERGDPLARGRASSATQDDGGGK